MSKYLWVSEEFDAYMKGEAEKLRTKLKNREAGTVMVSKLMLNNVIRPNNIHLSDIVVIKNKRITKKNIGRLFL